MISWFSLFKKKDKSVFSPTPKVLVVIITKDHVLPECLSAVLNQDYPKNLRDVMIHIKEPIIDKLDQAHHPETERIMKTYINCTDNRETARKIALSSDAERFLFVDSDVVIPPHAITELVRQPFDVIAGWYKVQHEERFTCGRWVEDNVFMNLYKVEPSVVRVDCVGMGCAMFSRKALSDIVFHHGTDQMAKTYIGGEKVNLILGECAVLGNLLNEKGYKMYMNGNVVCGHLDRGGDYGHKISDGYYKSGIEKNSAR